MDVKNLRKNNHLALILITIGCLFIPYNNCSQNFQTQSTLLPGADGLVLSSSFSSDPSGSSVDSSVNQGKILYSNNCATCHNSIDSSNILNKNSLDISNAISSVTLMSKFKSLTTAQISWIALALSPLPTSNDGGNTSGGGTTTPPLPTAENPPILSKFQCVAGDDPSPTPLRRLSKRQYLNTMKNVFNFGGVSDSASISTQVSTTYAMIPEDSSYVPGTGIASRLHGFDRTDTTVSPYHLDGYFFVATSTAEALVSNDAFLNNFLLTAGNYRNSSSSNPCTGASGSSISSTCVDAVISSLGFRTFRRPLKQTEKDSYKSFYTANAQTGPRDGISAVVSRFLMSPQFLYLVETEGTPVGGRSDLLQISPYELASRLAYTLSDSIPSVYLMAKAEDGSLLQDSVYNQEIDKLIKGDYGATTNYQQIIADGNVGDGESNRQYMYAYTAGEIVVDRFFSQWLRLDDILPFEYASKPLQVFTAGSYLSEGPAGHHEHYADMMGEVVNIYSYIFWRNKGTFSDLMTTTSLGYTTNDVQYLLGYTPASRSASWWKNAPDGYQLPNYNPGERDGILNRAAFKISGNEQTNPVRRGVFIQRQIFCQALPSPEPDKLPDRALSPPEKTPDTTTRDRFAQKTSSTTCMGCHSMINPTGFAMENFDSVGRARTKETIITETGEIKPQLLPINASATVPIGDEIVTVNGGSEFSRAIASSQTANQCFVRQYFRFAYGRTESTGDGCTLDEMYTTMVSKSMKDMTYLIPKQKQFRLHKVGSQ